MAEIKKPSCVLFDWDNTLVDTFFVIMRAHNEVLTHFGMEELSEAQAKIDIKESLREKYPRMFNERWGEAKDIFYQSFEKHHLNEIRAHIGAKNLLYFLFKNNIPCGLVSNKQHSYLEKEVTYLGWDDYFSVLVGAGEATKDKPDPAPILLALERMKFIGDRNNIWYVGDMDHDMKCAREAECHPVFVENSPMHTPEEIKIYAPLIYAKDCDNLHSIIANIF